MSQSRSESTTPRASRRDFLKASGIVAGAALAGNLSIARSAHAQGSDILKVGLIGCGGRGSGAAINAMNADKNAKIVALADAFQDRVAASLANLKQNNAAQVDVTPERCFAGFDAYKKVIASDVDVVILGETPHFRPMHLKAAIDAGKHVFCEKPVAVDAPGVRSVLASVEEAKKKNLNIVSGLCWRYHPAVRETMQRMKDGAIGDILSIQETYLTGAVGHSVQRTPGMSEMEFQMRSWYFFTWLSGDHNVEQHIHSLDKAAWAMNDEPPVAAWGIGGRQTPKLGDIYDHHAVVYEYANGAQVHAYCCQQPGVYTDVSDRFVGTKGICTLEGSKGQITGKNKWRYKGPDADMYNLEHVALFDAIRKGKPINNGLYMARSTMLAIMGRMVTTTGKRLTWDEAINSQQVLAPKTYAMDAEPPVMPDKDGKYPIATPGVTPFA
jgi:myo-inositol 2-dehydrogenase / D-chiro-inositol 1-dehydrogenase